MTLNEALEAIALYTKRISELQNLRSQNGYKEERNYGDPTKTIVNVPMYDVKKVDKLLCKLARELRVLTSAIKKTNALTDVKGYEKVSLDTLDLGELEEFEIVQK